MNWLFLAVVLFIFIMGVYGYVRGILRMLYSVAALIVSIAAMVLIAPFLASILKSNATVMNTIESPIINTIGERIDENVDVESVLSEYYHLPKSISEKINELVSDDVASAKINIAQSIAREIAEYICDLLSYIIVFILIRIVIVILEKVLHIVEKLPVIGTLNHFGGVTLALVEAVGCIWIFFIIIQLFHTSHIGQLLINMVWENDFLRALYDNNIFNYFTFKNL